MTTGHEKVCIIFRACFCLFFLTMYVFWCVRDKTILPLSISEYLSSCRTTRMIYLVSSMFILVGFIVLFCIRRPAYIVIAVLAVLVFCFDVRRHRVAHYTCAMLYVSCLSVVILCSRWWPVVLIPVIIGLVSHNLCLVEISFLCLMVWFI
jgi:hypothetical protein